jgi:hypothetical protein
MICVQCKQHSSLVTNLSLWQSYGCRTFDITEVALDAMGGSVAGRPTEGSGLPGMTWEGMEKPIYQPLEGGKKNQQKQTCNRAQHFFLTNSVRGKIKF